MAFQVSPGVLVQETDLSTIIPAVATTPAGIAGYFSWGPVAQRILIDSESSLVQLFGAPDANTYQYFFSAANFLAYGNNLQVVRVVDSSNTNAVAGATATPVPILIKNSDHYENNVSPSGGWLGGGGTGVVFAGKYAGKLGNSLQIDLCDGVTAFNGWSLSAYFTNPPGTSPFVENYGGANDEIHVVIRDANGKFSGSTGSVLELHEGLSKARGARKADGSSNYYVDVLNDSKYVWWINHPTGLSTRDANDGGSFGIITPNAYSWSSLTGSARYSFTGGNAVAPSESTVSSSSGEGYGLFTNTDNVDVSLLIAGPLGLTAAKDVADIAKARLDCVAFVSPDVKNPVATEQTKLDTCIALRNNIGNNSYCFIDTGYRQQYDRYNDVYRWTCLNGDIAGLCARTDLTNDPWWSPAGFNRGQIRNLSKLAYNPTSAHRDALYSKGVNPVVTFPGEGTILYGDKTAQTKPSAFDRINVRRLFITLEKAISIAAKYQLFEFNDAFTRAIFVSTVEPFLRDVQSRRGIFDFKVVCDETNNTAEVVDSNRFVATIFVKPSRSISTIALSFVATRSNVSFDEITALNSL